MQSNGVECENKPLAVFNGNDIPIMEQLLHDHYIFNIPNGHNQRNRQRYSGSKPRKVLTMLFPLI